MTKRLIALISPEGKSKEQLTDEMYEAVQKYFRVEKEVLANTANVPNSKSLDELITKYRAGPEQETVPQGHEEAFVSFHSKKTEKEVLNPDNLIEDMTEQEEGTAYQIFGLPDSKEKDEK